MHRLCSARGKGVVQRLLPPYPPAILPLLLPCFRGHSVDGFVVDCGSDCSFCCGCHSLGSDSLRGHDLCIRPSHGEVGSVTVDDGSHRDLDLCLCSSPTWVPSLWGNHAAYLRQVHGAEPGSCLCDPSTRNQYQLELRSVASEYLHIGNPTVTMRGGGYTAWRAISTIRSSRTAGGRRVRWRARTVIIHATVSIVATRIGPLIRVWGV